MGLMACHAELPRPFGGSVHDFDHQKTILGGVRQLADAYERRQRVESANRMWSDLLSHGIRNAKEAADRDASAQGELHHAGGGQFGDVGSGGSELHEGQTP